MATEIYWNGLTTEEEALVREVSPILRLEQGTGSWQVTCQRQNQPGIQIRWESEKIFITYGKKVELARAYSLLVQKIHQGDLTTLSATPAFQNLSFMQDCSRNGVPKVQAVKSLFRYLAIMGYDSLQLYTEDTFSLEDYPYFGYLRGRYSQEELKSLDEYGRLLGIELIPCIQTLAHLNGIFRWKSFQPVRDTGDILLCGEEQTYELIETIIKTCAESFTSRQINIGMDEAEQLGLGRYLEKFGYQERFAIMDKHLRRVEEICRRYGFIPMMWSDMFFKMLGGGSYHSAAIAVPEKVKRALPENMGLIYWDYYSREAQNYDRMFEQHKQITNRVIFAGGAWRWNGYAPLLSHSLLAGELALTSCRQKGIKEVILTAWGDNGAEASLFSVLPVLVLYGEGNYQPLLSKEITSQRLQSLFGLDLEAFLALEKVNLTPDNPIPGRVSVGPARYLLYQDPLLGLFDKHVDPKTYPLHFSACAKALEEVEAVAGELAYIFTTLKNLAEVLAEKATLGLDIKTAYDSQDKAVLALELPRLDQLRNKVDQFHLAVITQWEKENKAFGREIIDLRLGGLKERLGQTKRLVERYLAGEISEIEELIPERLLLDERENPGYQTLPLSCNRWSEMVSPADI